ncbi:MAG TPA: nucleotidyl transferase AbiEii/AbiGii toxin family protein [Polyangiaceae bacterium]|nr:nucleotidyl transferase AbiEii/AbiGii toxin family protein [Polyangiaceae bacterium]
MSPLHAAAAISLRERILLARRDGYARNMSELPDKLRAIEAAAAVFGEERTPYALIGGLAVGIRSGIPRATENVDFAVPSSASRQNLTVALERHGFRKTGDFPHSVNFVHESGEPVQLASDPGFDAMIERAELITLGEFALRVVTKGDLIAMKRRAASDPARRRSKALRDAADVALLEGDVPDPNEGW